MENDSPSSTGENSKTLEELNGLIERNPEFDRFYITRANYYARTSNNSDIEACEIKSQINMSPVTVFRAVKRNLKQLREFIKNNEGSNESRLVMNIIKDLEKALSLRENYERFKETIKEKARRHGFYEVIGTTPSNLVEHHARANLLYNYYPFKVRECKDMFAQIVENSPDHYEAQLQKLICHRRIIDGTIRPISEYRSLITEYDKVIEVQPNYSVAYFHKGVVQIQLGHHGEAVNTYSTCIKIGETFYDDYLEDVDRTELLERCYYNRASCHRILGNQKEMFDDFEAVIKLNPNNTKCFSDRANYYRIFMKNYEKALVDYNSALKINQNYQMSLFGRGFTYMKLGEFNLAIIDLTNLLNLLGNSERNRMSRNQGLYYRGKCFLKQERFEESIIDFSEGRKLGNSFCGGKRLKAVELLKKKIMRM